MDGQGYTTVSQGRAASTEQFNTPTRQLPSPPPPRVTSQPLVQTPPLQQTTYLTNNQYATLAEGDESDDEVETKHENDPIHFSAEELDVIRLLGAQAASEATTEVDTLTREEETHHYHEETPSSEEHNGELGQEVQEDSTALRGEPNASEETP